MEQEDGAPLSVDDSNATDEERRQLKELFERFVHVFSQIPGRAHIYQHVIHMAEAKSFIKRSYPMPYAQREPTRLVLADLLNHGIICEETSSYCNPLVAVQKKSGELRLCLDGRWLNKNMVAETDVTPPLDDLLQQFADVRYFFTIDLTSRKFTSFVFDGTCYTRGDNKVRSPMLQLRRITR